MKSSAFAVGISLVAAHAAAQVTTAGPNTMTGRLQSTATSILLSGSLEGALQVGGDINVHFDEGDENQGVFLRTDSATVSINPGTSTFSGTFAVDSFNAATIKSAAAVTLTDTATVYVAGVPVAGPHASFTNGYAIEILAGGALLSNGLTVQGGPLNLNQGMGNYNTYIGAGTNSGPVTIGNGVAGSVTNLKSAMVALPNIASNTTTPNHYVCLSHANLALEVGASSCAVSSIRWKTDVVPLDGGVAEVTRLRPVSYVLTSKAGGRPGQGRQTGLIAEEVAKVDPRLVDLGPDGRPRAVRYNGLTAVLAKAVQDEQREIEAQGSEIEILRAKVKAAGLDP